MPGTRSSARLAEKSSPPASQDNKRKADDTQSSPSKRGRKDTAEQKTIEETLKPDDNMNNEQKPSEQANESEQKPAATTDGAEEKQSEATKVVNVKNDNSIKKVGESFEGTNKEGESKDDPEKALKDSRGGAGLNSIDPEKPKPAPEDLPIVRS